MDKNGSWQAAPVTLHLRRPKQRVSTNCSAMAAFKVLLGLFATALIVGEISSANSCPLFWESFAGNCYYPVYGERVTYQEAKAGCEGKATGAHVAVPRNDEEHRYLKTTILRGLGPVWLGCDDTEEEGTFKCADGDTLTHFKKWTTHQPDNGETSCDDPQEENCVMMRHSGGWWDVKCDTTLYYMCQL